MYETEIARLTREIGQINEQRKAFLDAAEKNVKESRTGLDNLGFASTEERTQFDGLNSAEDAIMERRDALAAADQRAKAHEKVAVEFGINEQTLTDSRANFASQFDGLIKRGDPFTINPVKGASLRDARNGNIENRALSSSTSTAGANTIPTRWISLIQHMVEANPILDLVDSLITASGEPLTWPRTSSYGAAVSEIAEAATIAGTDLAFNATRLTLGAFKFGQVVDVPKELLTDSMVDIEALVLKATGIAIGQSLAARVMNGTGSSQSRGIILDSTLGVTGSASVAGAFTCDNLIDLEYSVTEPYAANAVWMARRATVGAMRKLKDTTNQYLWQPSLIIGQPAQFDGAPVISEPTVPAVALSAKSVLFGDPMAYLLRLVGGITFERDDSIGFKSDMVSFKATLRADGGLKDLTGAIKFFAGNAA
jgi:HK97 family phage major capsid protein